MKPEGVGKPATHAKGWQTDTNPAGKTKGKGFTEHNKHYLAFKAEQEKNTAPVDTTPVEETPSENNLDVEA